MENKKLISVRLDPQTLESVDDFVSKHYYWKRSTVISNILDAVFECFDENAIYNMVRFDRDYFGHAKGSFTLDARPPSDDS